MVKITLIARELTNLYMHGFPTQATDFLFVLHVFELIELTMNTPTANQGVSAVEKVRSQRHLTMLFNYGPGLVKLLKERSQYLGSDAESCL